MKIIIFNKFIFYIDYSILITMYYPEDQIPYFN